MRARYIIVLVVLAAAAVAGITAITRMNGLSTRAAPTFVERTIARTARRWATPRRARSAVNPVPFSETGWAEARAHFADHCASCHANDGSGATEIGQNLYPQAPDMRLADTQNLTDGELYWIIENGVRLTGMPAWGSGGADDAETWNLVHFIRKLKDLSSEQLQQMEGMNPRNPLELQEELDDRRFLAGEDVDAASSGVHHHQEAP